ncbi:glycoside hydrolase family 5 protein [Clostridium sp. SHJSY1]|uniref:glycoside hydrolase family 5 protein n=1 Tax=Clostridium sp. SHJSY1 TaxID=2942483 RepID=UPI00287BAA91|nr:glycoside hydrolase family 5 protein [Clostridium sp. SHJSY1]
MIKRRKLLILALTFSAITAFKGIDTSASTASGMRNITAQQLVDDMKVGWNLGNTLDADGRASSDSLSSEWSWGNPKTTHAMIDKIKAAGFNTVRIPTTWYDHMGSSPNYTIDANWFKRVEEVMNYAFDNDMYVILNLHHENSWIVPTYAKQQQATDQLTKVWTQIANKFNKYGDHLIFETMNEPRPIGAANEWTGGSFENRDVVNKYNLAAVNTIRNTGGNNKTRCIMVPTVAASASAVTINDLVIPNNDNRVIVSLHMYSPYSFAMDINGTSSWGSTSDKMSLDAELEAVSNKFVKNGHPVVVGEFGTINKNNQPARAAHAEYFVKAARSRHITPVWWDNGVSTVGKSETYGIFNRNKLTWDCPEVVQALTKGANSAGNISSNDNNSNVTKTLLYNFDSNIDGWVGSNISGSISSSNEWNFNGGKSLKADINLSSGSQYYLARYGSQNINGKSQLKAIVRHSTSGNQGSGMGAKLYIKTGSTYQWFDGGFVNINSSTSGTELTLNLSKVSNLNDIKEIGIQYITGKNASGKTSIYTDYITVQ